MSEGGLEARLHELESRLAWQDEVIDKLNDVIRGQWEHIDRHARQILALEQRVAEIEHRLPPDPVAPPPHY